MAAPPSPEDPDEPAALTGKSSAPLKSHSSGTIWARLSSAYWRSACAIASCGQSLSRLPGEVGSPQQQRDADRGPGPRRADDLPPTSDQETRRHARPQKQQRVLVLEPDACRDANGEPEASVGAGEELHEEPQDEAQARRSGSVVVSRWPAPR